MDMLWCQGVQNIELSNHKLKSTLTCTVWSQCMPVPDRRMDIVAIARRFVLSTHHALKSCEIRAVWRCFVFYDAYVDVQSRSGALRKMSLRNFDRFTRCLMSFLSGVVWLRRWQRSCFHCSEAVHTARPSQWIACTVLLTLSRPPAASRCMNQIFRMYPKISWSKFLVRNHSAFITDILVCNVSKIFIIYFLITLFALSSMLFSVSQKPHSRFLIHCT